MKKKGRSMNNINDINARANSVNKLSLFGASAMGFPDKISTVRGGMMTRHSSQRVVLDKPEFPYIFTGAENPFGKRSSWNVVADDDYVIMKVFKKFKDFPGSYTVYILKNTHTGKYSCQIYEGGAHHLVERYGFKMVNHIDGKREGDYIKKGDIIQQSSSYVKNNYSAGINARIIYTVLPELTEDSLIISESFAKRIKYNMVDTVEVKLNKNAFLLNTYGDDSLYKSFPNIGEEIKDDILCSIRENSYVSSKREAKNSHMNDQDKISHGIVVDIDIESNVDVDNEQLNYYRSQIQDFYSDIYGYISTIVQDPSQDDTSLLDLYHAAEKYIKPFTWVTKENIVDTVIKFKILQPVEISTGQKVVGRYGNKSVVSDIIPDHLMPKTDDGRPVDMLANGLSINNRIVAFTEYESTITFQSERMWQHLKKLDSEGTSRDVIMDKCIEFVNIYNSEFANDIARMYSENPDEVYNDIMNNGIYIHIPPLGDTCIRDAILDAYDKYGDIMKPYKVYAKLRHRWIEIAGEHAIGYQYTWVLKQEPSKGMSTVSTGRTTLYDQPVKTRAFNKNNTRRYSDNPIKFGEYDTYNFLSGVSVEDFAKITTYFRGSQYEENSVLMTTLNNTKLDMTKYNAFPQLDNLKNMLKFFGEKMQGDVFGYGCIGTFDREEEIYFNNVPVKISVPELRHILITYSYYTQYRSYKGGVVDLEDFFNNMLQTNTFDGYEMKYKLEILQKFASMIPILDQLKDY